MNSIFETLESNFIEFNDDIIRIIIDENEKLWINANDLVEALEYKDIKSAIREHVDKEHKKYKKDINNKLKGQPNAIYLSEAGMYKLILTSRMKIAKQFSKWVTDEVLPSIRKYGTYKLQQKTVKEHIDLITKLNILEEENKNMKAQLKKEKYPEGGLVYVIDYSTKNNEIYRIGMTGDMNKRKQVYDTHTLNSNEVVYMMNSDCPIQLEHCVRSMLYKYRIINKKDYYQCSIKVIKNAFNKCKESLACINNQKGGMIEDEIKVVRKMLKINEKYLAKYEEQLQ